MTGRTSLIGLFTIVLTSLLIISSCSDEFEKTNKTHNLTLTTRAGETAAEQMPYIRLFNFHHNGANDKKFYQEILNLTRTANVVSAQVEAGQWNMALVSNPNGGTVIPPAPNTLMAQVPLYKYEPTYPTGGKTTDAHEMYLDNRLTPVISENTPETMNAQLNRTVAKVKLIIEKTTPNFNLSSTKHKIKLHNIPSTISYTGSLLPSAANPDTLSQALEAPVTLVSSGTGSFEGSEAIVFMIPAHRGDAYTSATPTEFVGVKMDVTLMLERTGGTMFAKQMEIPVVAQCNKVLEVRITVNDGLEFETNVLDWDGVDINSTVGAGYQNWLYVKQGATGNGMSWSDPLPNISSATSKAKALIAAGKTVNGVLVAGGSGLTYTEGFTVSQGVRVYGGWAGTPNTELAATATATDVYASTARDLKTYKARVNAGTGSIEVSGAGASLDGFVITGQASDAGSSALLHINNATAYVNAVEITGNSAIAAGKHALRIDAGTAANILCAQNNGGVYMRPATPNKAILLNATVAENTGLSDITTGTLLNCVFWKNNTITYSTATTEAQCSAFNPTILANIPSGTNVPLGDTNDEWFTVSSYTPGPHFDMNNTSGRKYYEPGTSKPNRSPMLRRGSKALFDNNYPVTLADANKTDIDGKIRYHAGIDGNNVVDMGCYEDGSLSGFQLKWASDRIYISSKKGYVSETPLMLPANADTDINIEINWTVTIAGTGTMQYGAMVDTPPINGTGDGYVVGSIKIETLAETNSSLKDVYGNYNGNAERQCGTLRISSSLGNYLPDANMEVWQTPGKSEVWYEGYVGSFHRSDEVGARYITGTNSGNWTVRIISGLDWIKIDNHDKDYGNIISGESYAAGGYSLNYREVEEAWGGAVSGSGNIKFRVGMKSKNTTGTPRYGLIVITRSGGVAMFFVRQGQEADYLYRLDDGRTQGQRTAAKKFSPFSLGDPDNGTGASKDLGAKGGRFVRFPTQVGYFFQKNQTIAYLRGAQTASLPTIGASITWNASNDVCPPGYRHATYTELIHSCYQHVAVPTGNTAIVGQEGDDAKANFVWGRYADGWYDQLAPDPVLTATEFLPSAVPTNAAQRPFVATKGMLMVNHYNYAALFFPTAGTMLQTSPTAVGQAGSSTYGTVNTAMFRTSTHVGTTAWGNTHWLPGHVGTTCTSIATSSAAYVRCVVE